MEISKESEIFKIINDNLLLKNDKNKLVVNINNLNWTEAEFNNFNNVMNSFNFKEEFDSEQLEVITGNNNLLIINNMSNIIKFCMSNSYDNINHSWNKKNIIQSKNLNNYFDYDINFSLIEYSDSYKPENWDDIRKQYIITKNFKYIDENNTEFIASIIKKNKENDEFITFAKSNVIKEKQTYNFKIVIKNNDIDIIIPSIIKIMQAITLHPLILTKDIQKSILEEYNNLIKKDIEISNYNKRNGEIPLLAPKPITLEKINLIDPSEYGSVSILEEYTVTEKADGERLLLYINNTGNVYLINNTYSIIDTGMTALSNLYNSLIDGEYILCNKRLDSSSKGLYAAFDMYYIKGNNITSLPLIDEKDKKSRYNYLKFAKDSISDKNAPIEFIIKNYNVAGINGSIFEHSKKILTNVKKFPYEIDGLIYTPTKLALYSYYENKPVQITDNVKWDRVFKWKPPEQNTIDFLVKFNNTILENGQKYKELKLYVGYNSSQWEDIGPEKGLKLRYDFNYFKEYRKNFSSYEPVLFKPNVYYSVGVETAYVKINSKGEIRAKNGDKIEDNSIIEFSYELNNDKSVNLRWSADRVREDKTRLYRQGKLSKTLNDLTIALNIWRCIHNNVTTAMIMGNDVVFSKEASDSAVDRILETDDVYYTRNIPRESLLSLYMLNFHNQGIKKKLYSMPTERSSLLELCGGEGGDMNRWLDNNYTFILSIDLVKKNIYNPRSGGYSRILKQRNRFKKMNEGSKVYFPDIVFATGDCSESIRDGQAAAVTGDKESEKILKLVMNKHNKVYEPQYKYIIGKGYNKFSVCSCQFAIHYFFKNEEKLNGFFTNVSQNLKQGGYFFCTFMDGNRVIREINNNDGNMIEGRKFISNNSDKSIVTWAIIRRFNWDIDNKYNKKIDVYIENTQQLIPEYLVDYDLLLQKAKEFNLELVESNTFEHVFDDIKSSIPEEEADMSHLQQDIIELDKDPIQKKFSFLNRYAIFKKK